MDWDKLRVFHAVAEAGSFTHAGEALNLSQSAVSRQISALEESLSVPLFHRHARGLILTEQGDMLYQTARDVFAKLSMTEAMLSESREAPKGPLKVTTTVAFGTTWLAPRIREFLTLHPDIQFTLLVNDGELDLAMREADLAIRMNAPRQPDLIQRHLMTLRFHIYAHANYIKRCGTPRNAADLDHHDIIAFPEDTRPNISDINLLLECGASTPGVRKAILRINNMYGIFRAVESGLGIAMLPDYMAEGRQELVKILPEIETPKIEAFFVYAEELRHSKRIAVFRDFLVRKVSETVF
ncbi:MAG: LysR family transcriptional regulator [Rhodospirillaceae bacterium]